MREIAVPYYRVMLNGANFLIDMDGRKSMHGFFTFRGVESVDPDEAEHQAVQALRDDPRLQKIVLNPATDPPTIQA